MSKLAKLAGTKKLKGKVAVSRLNGTTTTYPDEAAANKACAGFDVEHRDGAFFELKPKPKPTRKKQEKKPKAKTPTPPPPLEEQTPTEE